MLNNSMLYPCNTASRRAVSLDGMWKFCLDEKSQGLLNDWKDGIPGEDYIPVPASFADFYTDKKIREYTGDFWYERDFFVPGEWQGKQVFLRFGSATHRATVFVNGIEAGSHIGGFLPFAVDITAHIAWNQSNKVTVLVNNELSVTNIPCGSTKVLADGRKVSRPYFDFYNYSGLQRSIQLVAVPVNHIFDFEVSHEICGNDADVSYNVVTVGDAASGKCDVQVHVLDASGKEVACASGKNGVLHIADVHLWQVRQAYLYTFVVQIVSGGQIIDEFCDEIGIRTVKVSGKDILINGQPVYLKGFGKHEDSDIVGRGFNPGVMKRDFECMKWIGANSFRTSHYPYAEEVYKMADHEGFLVIDEVPAVGMFESLMNFAEASSGRQTAFFDKETTPQLLENHRRAVEELIARDKNHACVIAWSLFNEPETTTPSARDYFEVIFDTALSLDMQKRPRTFAMIANSTPEKCLCYQLADVIALNRYYGWYILGGADIDDAKIAFEKEMDAWAAKDLNKPFIFTEYGADTMYSEHKLPSVMWSQEYQKEVLAMCHEVFDKYDFVRGEQVWNFADFQTTEGILRVNGNKKGIFTRQRQPKDAAFYLKERWENLPLSYKA